MSDQVIFDRGYRSYDGPRRGTSGARRAVYKDGVRRILGLGRKAKQKIFPWSLITIAILGAVGFIGAHWAGRELAGGLLDDLLPAYGELFDFYSWVSLLFIASVGPALLIPDRVQGVLSVYFSRPLTVDGYLVGKTGAFMTLVGGIYLIPQILLHIGLALISTRGFAGYLADTAEVLWKVPITALAFVALHGAIVLALSAFINRPGFAAATFLGIFVAGGEIAARVAEADFPGARWASLLALDHHPRIIRDHFFDDTVDYAAELAGFDVWVSGVVIAVMVVLSFIVVRYRYRKLA